jgi:hypothetical protein
MKKITVIFLLLNLLNFIFVVCDNETKLSFDFTPNGFKLFFQTLKYRTLEIFVGRVGHVSLNSARNLVKVLNLQIKQSIDNLKVVFARFNKSNVKICSSCFKYVQSIFISFM